MSVTADSNDVLQELLKPTEARFHWVRDRLISLLESGEAPSLSASALKLMDLLSREGVQMEDLEKLIEVDPGLASRCIRVASSVMYGARSITSIQQALMTIGFSEIRRLACAIGVVDAFSRLKVQVDWKKFWLHSLLVGRLTQSIAAKFRPTTGAEYLAGLLHDMGKLVIEHNFPTEFEAVLLRSLERNCGHAVVERHFLGIDHARIGAAMCHVMKVTPAVRDAVLHHHSVFNALSPVRRLPDQGLLTACVATADALANSCGAGIVASKAIGDVEKMDSWKFLTTHFKADGALDLDLEKERDKADADLSALGIVS
ncbi:MAG: hypothetical protein RLZZ399_1089 [Verrucomicrobiota bacterium]|jgi:putative nucleotidyltransferase with HDIG domain